MANDGENSNGSEFMITLGKADMLDGYHSVIGELVEGDEVLKEAESSLTRLGTFDSEIKIESCGTRWSIIVFSIDDLTQNLFNLY